MELGTIEFTEDDDDELMPIGTYFVLWLIGFSSKISLLELVVVE
jgi:hypothetical protein